MKKVIILLAALVATTVSANAQYYRYYPNYYGYGSYRAPYYGGGLSHSSCGYYGCYAQHRGSYSPRSYAPRGGYNWSWGGGNRGYLGGRGGGWGGEW